MKLDKTDLKILKQLQENGRITNLQLSNEVGLSPAPTLERVKKLEKNKVIESYHAKVNNAVVGLGIEALIMINLVRQIDNAISDFKKGIANIPEIVECYQITGNSDYIIKVVVEDISAFEQLIANKLSKMEQIGQMQSMVVLSKIKESPVAPLNYEE
jgi:Lrp/AsnC family leucine-responsive transcriptional regulator